MRKIYLTILLGMCGLSGAYAQQESTLFSMRSLHQANYLNPSVEPQQAFYLGLPGISSIAVGLGSNSLSYNKVLMAEGDLDAMELDVSKLRGVLKDKNYLSQFAEVDVLSLGFRLNARVYLNYRASAKVYNQFMFTKGLLDVVETDTENFNTDFSIAPRLQHTTYLEHSLGASYKVNRKLSVGANLKFLRGGINVNTESLSLDVKSVGTEENIEFEASGNMLVRTSGVNMLQDDLDDIDYPEAKAIMKANSGFALDLGASYALTNRLTLGASVLNFGGITWKNDGMEYRVEDASFYFNAVESEDPDFEALIEEAEDEFVPEETELDSYRTKLPTRFLLSATYALHRSVNASGLLFAESYDGRLAPGFTAAISKDFGRRMGVTLSYTAVNNTYANLGAGLSLRLTPFQFYIVTDNALAPIMYKDAQHVNLRTGINFVIGTLKTPSKLPYATK